MKICLLVKDFAVGKKFSKNGLPTKSGAEFHAENHARQLMKRGNQITIMAKKRYWFTKARENLNGIDLVRLHGPFRWLEIFFRLFVTHRDMDAFYIIGTPKFAVWAILYANLTNKPVTLALTGKAEIFDGEANWKNRIFRRCTNYIAISHEIRDGFVEKSGVSADRVTVLPHGIDTAKYPQVTEAQKSALKCKYGFKANEKVLLFCARVVMDKGIDTLQKLWRKLHVVEPTAKLLVVGGGRTDLLAELRELSQELDASIMVVGEVDETQEYYQMADVFVFPSRHEGLPTSLIEAMSSGLPAVVSDIGGCNDLVLDGEMGFRVYSEDVDGFLEKILYLFAHEKERLSMGKSAAKFVREKCDYSFIVDKLETVIGSKEPRSADFLG